MALPRSSRFHFQGTLKSRERVNFDPEDTIAELWAVLKAKDSEWSPDRGKYITFAGVIVDREFCSIRDRSRTVQSPRNSSCRLKEYSTESEGGVITSRRSKTESDIKRTSDGITQIISEGCRGAELVQYKADDAATILADQETAIARREALKAAIQSLEPFEAAIIGKLWGLWGREPKSIFTIAWEAGREQADVRRVSARAMKKIQGFLVASYPRLIEMS